jgi:hypothetical protein
MCVILILSYPTYKFENNEYIKLMNMGTITHSQVNKLVNRLPAKKLPLAYNLLADLAEKESSENSHQLNFLLLPINERRRIMAQQAEEMVSFYKETAHERKDWQAGDFIDEC